MTSDAWSQTNQMLFGVSVTFQMLLMEFFMGPFGNLGPEPLVTLVQVWGLFVDTSNIQPGIWSAADLTRLLVEADISPPILPRRSFSCPFSSNVLKCSNIFILGLVCSESPFFWKLIYADQVSICFSWESIMCLMKIAASSGHQEGFSLLFISHLFEVSL